MMKASPDLRVFIAGGMFDGVFPCAVGDEMARRDLREFGERVQSKCYSGGHMMYGEAPVAEELSSDVRAFIGRLARPAS